MKLIKYIKKHSFSISYFFAFFLYLLYSYPLFHHSTKEFKDLPPNQITKININLENKRFKGKNFPVNLFRCFIFSSSFKGSDLTDRNMSGCRIRSSLFYKVNFKKSLFIESNINHTVFKNSNLSLIRLKATSLMNSSFKNVDLRGADLKGTEIVKSLFKNVDLRGADLSDTVLTGSIFKNVLIDKDTKLPFSFKVAKKHGFVFKGLLND